MGELKHEDAKFMSIIGERSVNYHRKKQFNIEGEIVVLEKGQSIKIEKNTRVQYSNPFGEPCEYLAICKPAFDFNKVHREEE